MHDTLLVANAGSSSIKFKLYNITDDGLTVNMSGMLDGVGSQPRLLTKDAQGKVLLDHHYPVDEVTTPSQAEAVFANWIANHLETNIAIVGHRVVHGGLHYSGPALMDDQVLLALEGLVPLAPLHQPSNLGLIRLLQKLRPTLPQVACFDTAFHHGHDPLCDRFALPRALYDEGIRRYGFHGLSYEYVSAAMQKQAPNMAQDRVVIAHLGSGASLCALHEGKSIDSSMGFTALDGIPMATRSGAVDPGVVLHLMTHKRMTPREVERMLYHESGLLGLSGISKDARQLLDSDSPDASMAIDYFCLKVAQAVTGLATTLGGLDGLVFTAGIGENSPDIRQGVITRLAWLGLKLDDASNQRNASTISSADSRATIMVIPTDEEKIIAQHTLQFLRQ